MCDRTRSLSEGARLGSLVGVFRWSVSLECFVGMLCWNELGFGFGVG